MTDQDVVTRDKVMAACEQAIAAIKTLDRQSWPGWVVYILEGLEEGLNEPQADDTLWELIREINRRLERADWD